MDRMGYTPDHVEKFGPEWKPTWKGLAIDTGYDLLVFLGKVVVIFFVGTVAFHVIVNGLAVLFAEQAPTICAMLKL